ncbi:hypothetical protein MRX96_056837 [Rhipicephalus microplus]
MPGVRFFRCPRCASTHFFLKALFRHLRTAHGHEPNWVCGLGGCMETFRRFFSYKRHVYRKHAAEIEGISTRDSAQMMMAQVSTNAAPAIPHDEEEKSNVPVELPDALRSSSDYGYQLAALLLKWKEGRRLPESTVHELANDVIDFVEAIADHQQMPSDNEPAANLQEICKDQLDQLRTRCGRKTYWKAHFPLVESRTVVLHETDTMEYVPLCDVLKAMLERSQLSNECNSYSTDGYMRSVFDGSAFKNHKYFDGDTSKLCLQIYSDEFEVCNPLGSKRGKHKMTAFYFSVLNFEVKFRSALSEFEVEPLYMREHKGRNVVSPRHSLL